MAHGAWVWRKTQWGFLLGSQKDHQCLWERLWTELLVHGTCWSLPCPGLEAQNWNEGWQLGKQSPTQCQYVVVCLRRKHFQPTKKRRTNSHWKNKEIKWLFTLFPFLFLLQWPRDRHRKRKEEESKCLIPPVEIYASPALKKTGRFELNVRLTCAVS